MGFFNFLTKKAESKQGKPATAVAGGDDLRKQLFEIIDRNHLTEFELFCVEYENDILRSFASWKKTPEEIQTDKEAVRKYAYCLMVIASYFQKQRNRGELLTMLTGIDDSQYSRQWQEQLGQCQHMMQKELRFQEALPLLEQCLDLASGVSGAGVDKFLPLTLGFIGECNFQLNQMDKAHEFVERALQTTSMQGDYDASMAYLANLYEISRYSANYDAAIKYAKDAAERAYDRGELVTASNWRHHARAVEKGEPLYRIVLKIGDEYFELDEIPKVHGERVEFIFVRNRIELVLCSQKCFQGREVTSQGDYDQAVRLFDEAKLLDPWSQQPLYMAGNIKLAGRRYAEALEDLKKVEELCPGFETTRADLWLAEQLASGKMEHDACKAVYETNNEEIPLLERVAFCYELIEKYPHFGECYWRLGKMLIEKEEPEVAVEVFKKGIELGDEQDVLSRLYRDLAILTQEDGAKRELFQKSAALEKGNTLAQAMSLYMLRQMDPD